MAHTDFEYFKWYTKTDDYSEDDAHLHTLHEAAEDFIIRMTQRTAEELLALGGGQFPAPLAQAVCMLGAHWNNQHEAVGSGQMQSVPYTLDALVKPFRKLSESV